MRDRSCLLFAALLLVGCTPPEDTDKPDTDGDTGEPVVYDPGCITVDGEGGYAWLNDAIHVAAEGATIEVCAGTFEEAVVVDKPVTIVGAGVGETIWIAPTGSPTFAIGAVSGASLSGMTLVANRSAVELEGSAGTVLADLLVEDAPNYGVEADDASGTVVRASTFTRAAWGAVRVDGGSASVEDTTFTDNLGFGVQAVNGADVAVSGCTLTGTTYTELGDDGSVSDGFAVFAEDAARLALAGNVFADNLILSIFATETDEVTLDGDAITGGLYGIYQVYGDLSLQDVRIQDPTEYGIFYLAPGTEAFTADGLEVTGDPEVVSYYAYDPEAGETTIAGTGLYLLCTDITLTNSRIQGYNGGGAIMVPYDGESGTAVLEEVTFEDNGRWGLLADYLDVAATNVSVTGLRAVDEPPASGTLYGNYPGAVVVELGNLAWSGGTVAGSGGWGISSVASNISISGATFSENTLSAVLDLQGTSRVEGCAFSSGGGSYATYWGYATSGMILSGSSFVDNVSDVIFDYTPYYGYPAWMMQTDQGQDVTLSGGTLEAWDNTFEGGGNGVYVYDGTAWLHENTWSGYRYGLVDVSTDGEVLLENSTVTGWAGQIGYCYNGTLEVDGLVATEGSTAEYSYEFWENDELSWSGTGTYYGQGFYLYLCEALLEGVELTTLPSYALQTNDSTLEVDGFAVSDACSETSYYDVISLNWSSGTVEAYVNDLEVNGSTWGRGLYAYQGSKASFAAFSFTDAAFSGTGSHGISLSGLTGASFSGLTVSGAAGDGVATTSADVAMELFQVSGCTGDGVDVTGGTAVLDGGTVEGNTGAGVRVRSGSLVLSGTTITGNGSHGLTATDATLDAVGNTITANAEYGLVCSGSVTVDACGNDVTGNTSGENNGCDEACVVPPS